MVGCADIRYYCSGFALRSRYPRELKLSLDLRVLFLFLSGIVSLCCLLVAMWVTIVTAKVGNLPTFCPDNLTILLQRVVYSAILDGYTAFEPLRFAVDGVGARQVRWAECHIVCII